MFTVLFNSCDPNEGIDEAFTNIVVTKNNILKTTKRNNLLFGVSIIAKLKTILDL